MLNNKLIGIKNYLTMPSVLLSDKERAVSRCFDTNNLQGLGTISLFIDIANSIILLCYANHLSDNKNKYFKK